MSHAVAMPEAMPEWRKLWLRAASLNPDFNIRATGERYELAKFCGGGKWMRFDESELKRLADGQITAADLYQQLLHPEDDCG